MGSLLSFIFTKLHWIIILYSGWIFYNDYNSHQDQVQQLEDKIPVLEAKIKKKKREVELIESFKRDLENSKRKVESVASVSYTHLTLPTICSV